MADIQDNIHGFNVVFNENSTHVSGGLLMVRLDFYPTKGSKTYDLHNIDITNEETGKKSKQLNPALCHFITVPDDITKTQLRKYIIDTFSDDVMATIDDSLTKENSIHLISPYMKDKSSISKKKVTKDKTNVISDVNKKLEGFAIAGKDKNGKVEKVVPQSIDIGPGATNRASALTSNFTLLDEGNPANDTGTLDTIEIWANATLGGCKSGTFYQDGAVGTYTARDYATIGSVTGGSKQTFSGLSVDVETDDIIGTYYSSGTLERDASGGSSWILVGDQMSASQAVFSSRAYILSLYGTGTTGGGGAVAIMTTCSKLW
jgi:hypothetical protein